MNLDNLQPGETSVYATCQCLSKWHGEEKHTAFQMYMRDEAELTQKKLASGQFEYRVTRRREPPRERVVKQRHHYYEIEMKGVVVKP